MNEESLKYFYDALAAARLIEQFADGRSFEDYCSDELLSAAIERKFEIIGEALTRIRKRFPQDLEGNSDWSAIIGFRNVLAHGYDRIDDSVVWGIVRGQIPSLIRELSAIEGIEGDGSLQIDS